MTARPKLLFINPCTPDPKGTGWEQRAFYFLTAYAKFMDVELWFHPTFDNPDLVRLQSTLEMCRSATAFYPQLLGDTHLGFTERLNQSLSAANIVHVYRLQEIVAAISHSGIVWDMDELPWEIRDPRRNLAMPPVSSEQQRQVGEKFMYCIRKSRRVLASSKLEQQGIGNAVTVVPNVVALPDAGGHSPNVEQAARLLFVGNLNYSPNLLAVNFFRDAVLAILQELVPEVQVAIVGRSPTTTEAVNVVRSLQHDQRLQFHFDVPDCTPYYLQSAAAIAPILSGGGTRLKVIEAFAQHCPVVSTSSGCEGLEVEHGKNIFIANEPREFALACQTLLRNCDKRREMAANAFAYYEQHHSQQVVERLLANVVSEALGK